MILRNFVVFEGIDGTGTTTQLHLLRDRFQTETPVVFTAEPTNSEIGRLIRTFLKGKHVVHPDTMARLFSADRNEHLFGSGGIMELVDSGHAVFSDRYLFSSLAYQGIEGNSLLPERLNSDFPLPEYLFFFDIDPDVAMKRVESRNVDKEIYEQTPFQRIVRDRYLRILENTEKQHPDMQVIRINAEARIEEIAEKIWSIVRDLPKI